MVSEAIDFPATALAARARVQAIRPEDYARTRNALEGAVSYLSPYITHGLISLPAVLEGVAARHPLPARHKLVFELGWREYFRHVWRHRGAGILQSVHQGPLPDAAYAEHLPQDIRQGTTGVPVIDMAVRTLYATGYLHNHARMWLASYVVHLRKVHWRAGADWLYGHLLDGDLASNHLSWQWVAGTSSRKPYVFNADNVARFAPAPWHSPGSVLDQSYEALERWAHDAGACAVPGDLAAAQLPPVPEPALSQTPPPECGWTAPRSQAVDGRTVWLVHPWNLGDLPAALPADTVVVGVVLTDFHHAWPWSARRWRFVDQRMDQLVALRWQADAQTVARALAGARRVESVDDPHLQPLLAGLARCAAAPSLFAPVDRRCDAFSQWWTLATQGMATANDLLAGRTPSAG